MVGQQVLLYNSRLRLMSDKLHSNGLDLLLLLMSILMGQMQSKVSPHARASRSISTGCDGGAPRHLSFLRKLRWKLSMMKP